MTGSHRATHIAGVGYSGKKPRNAKKALLTKIAALATALFWPLGIAATLALTLIIVIILIIGGAAGSGGAVFANQLDCNISGPTISNGSGKFAMPMREGTYRLTSGFGQRTNPVTNMTENHNGQDFGAALGTSIYAAGDGVVTKAGPAEGFGQWIVLDHQLENQTVSTVYGHMRPDGVLVHEGDHITKGQEIAKVGDNGQSTGAHLHFEVWPGSRFGGKAVDPMPWISANGSRSADQSIGTIQTSMGNGNASTPSLSELKPYDLTGAQATQTLDADRIKNAETIIGVGKGMNIPPRGWVIALATALQESNLVNLDHGDRDSLGLFQQRPSQGWGTREQIMNPQYASQKFFETFTNKIMNNPNPPWARDPGWKSMKLTDPTNPAQEVQRSGFPTHYAKWEGLAINIVLAHYGAASLNINGNTGQQQCNSSAKPGEPGSGHGSGAAVPPELKVKTDWPAEQATVQDPTTSNKITPRMAALYQQLASKGFIPGASTCWDAHAWNPSSDHPTGRACDIMYDYPNPQAIALGWQAANWMVSHQEQLGIKYLIWQGQIWQASSPQKWTDYNSGVYGCPNPANKTGCHYDHIHISVY